MVAWKRLSIKLHCLLLWTALFYPKDDGSGQIRNLRTCLPTWTPWKPEVTFHVHTRIQDKTGTPPHIHFGQHQAAAVLTSRINRYIHLMRLSVQHSRCGRFGKDKISLCPERIQTVERPARNVFTVLTRIYILAVHTVLGRGAEIFQQSGGHIKIAGTMKQVPNQRQRNICRHRRKLRCPVFVHLLVMSITAM
jgi:hypothetical protein